MGMLTVRVQRDDGPSVSYEVDSKLPVEDFYCEHVCQGKKANALLRMEGLLSLPPDAAGSTRALIWGAPLSSFVTSSGANTVRFILGPPPLLTHAAEVGSEPIAAMSVSAGAGKKGEPASQIHHSSGAQTCHAQSLPVFLSCDTFMFSLNVQHLLQG